MLTKCANPGCFNHFLYMTEGKVFRFEQRCKSNGDFGFDPSQRIARSVEFFWLCSYCAATLTVVFRKESGIVVQRMDKSRGAAA